MDNEQTTATSNPSLKETLDEQHLTARDQMEAAWQLHVSRIEEQIATGWKEHLEHVIDERFREATARVEEAFARDMESRIAELRRRLRRDIGDRFNQLLRRVRKSETGSELHASVLDAAGVFCRRAALFAVEGQMLRCDGSRDVAADAVGQLADVLIPFAAAPALLNAFEGGDTVIAVRSASELSEQLAGFFGEAPDLKVGIFPIVSHGRTVGLLCGDGPDREIEVGSLELITMLAGITLEAKAAPAVQPAALLPVVDQVVRLSVLEPDLSRIPESDRPLHSRAQRFARVRVAEMRLYKAREVRAGRTRGDLYASLSGDIDAAREAFRTDFIQPCASMQDYLHLELVHSLANDDASLMGPTYPGALA